MQAAEHEGDLVEYPDGRTARIDAQGNIIGGDTVPAPPLDVIEDPFPAGARGADTWFDDSSESIENDTIETARTSKPIVALNVLRELPKYAQQRRRDARSSSVEETHAASDALLAIVRLRQMCTQMIETPTPINAEECLAFIEQAKQRLNVVALACPFLKVGK